MMHTWKPFACSIGEHSECWHFAQQKTGPAERLSFGSGESWPCCRASQQGKLLYLLEYNPWDAVFACMVHHADQWRDWGVRRPSSQFITRCLASVQTWHPWSLWARPMLHQISLLHRGSGPLPDGSRVGSSLFQGQIEDRQAKEDSDRETCECVVWCWKQPCTQGTFSFAQVCFWKRANILSHHAIATPFSFVIWTNLGDHATPSFHGNTFSVACFNGWNHQRLAIVMKTACGIVSARHRVYRCVKRTSASHAVVGFPLGINSRRSHHTTVYTDFIFRVALETVLV